MFIRTPCEAHRDVPTALSSAPGHPAYRSDYALLAHDLIVVVLVVGLGIAACGGKVAEQTIVGVVTLARRLTPNTPLSRG